MENIKRTYLLLAALFFIGNINAQNGNAQIEGSLEVGKFHSGPNPLQLFSTTSTNYTSVNTNNGYIGYMGTYNEATSMDFGTGATNSVGFVNLVTSAVPRLVLNPAGNVSIGDPNNFQATLNVKTNSSTSGRGLLIENAAGNADTWLPFTDGGIYLTADRDAGQTGNIYLRSFDNGIYTNRVTVDGGTGFTFLHKGLRVNGNGDGTAWAMGINGESIMRDAKIHIHEKASPSDNSDQGISYFDNSGTNNWTTAFGTANDYDFYFNNTLRAWIWDTDGSYHQSSDRRLKKNISELPGILDKVMKLKPSTYQYTSNDDSSPRSMGFIAQDVEKFFPEMVSTKGEYKGISYAQFGVIAIKAIQEQQLIIEDLKREIADLRKIVNRL